MSQSLQYNVSTIEEEPYLMRELDPRGGTRYVGYIKDLMDVLAERLKFQYTFRIPDDRQYGRRTPDGWTGIIGDVVKGTANIGAGALTVTSERAEAVKFTKPFLTASVNLLVKKPERLDLGLGYLVRPFSTDFWILLLVSIVIIGFLFFVIGYFSPYEWIKVTDDKDRRGAKNAFSLRNSYLFVLSSLTWQGFREPPRSISGRLLAAFWWIFVLFTIVAYTANLTAFLLARPEQMPLMPFKTYEDLVEANDIRVGSLEFGATQSALRTSRDSTLQNLWTKMSQQNSWVGSLGEGLVRIQNSNGKFVMLMESLTAEYHARKNCDLMLYGKSLFHRNMALATRSGDLIGDKLNQEIMKLQEEGELDRLYQRWWRFSGECSNIDGTQYTQKGDSLSSLPIYPVTLRDMAVAILLLFLGIIVAVVFLILELIYYTITTKGKIERPKMLNKKIFKAPRFTKGKSSKAAPSTSADVEAGTSEPLAEETLGEGTLGEGTSGEATSGEAVEDPKEV